jgi:hypothetical protein
VIVRLRYEASCAGNFSKKITSVSSKQSQIKE